MEIEQLIFNFRKVKSGSTPENDDRLFLYIRQIIFRIFMHFNAESSFEKLKKYCEKEQYRGWDPFDGLNSKLFQAMPLIRNNYLAKLFWIQLFKKNPVNLRQLTGIDKGYNPKGLALFLSGYCRLQQIEPKAEYLSNINWLAHEIIKLKTPDFSGACWGYNFDWQNRAFFQPRYSPTVVVTTFAGYSLLDAFEITGNELFKENALSIADFILKDLNRTTDNDADFAFSYSPFDHTQVINATLLGSRMLARIFHYTQDKKLLESARKSVAFSCKLQKNDGSWAYGGLAVQQWIDSFHTGYNLECLADYQKYSLDNSFNNHIESGLDYYLRNFFLPSGMPKYYHNEVFPVDIHSTSQLIITLIRLNRIMENQSLVEKVLDWTIRNMQSNKGYFYFQKNKWYTIKIPYMRWSQAWMFFALSEYLKYFKNQK